MKRERKKKRRRRYSPPLLLANAKVVALHITGVRYKTSGIFI